jgi:hypothetical protein
LLFGLSETNTIGYQSHSSETPSPAFQQIIDMAGVKRVPLPPRSLNLNSAIIKARAT